jgi:hypothetical protein
MRYLEGTDPAQTAYGSSGDILAFTAVYGLVLGVGFLVFGWRRKELWMTFWGGLLGLGSVAYIGAVLIGWGVG